MGVLDYRCFMSFHKYIRTDTRTYSLSHLLLALLMPYFPFVQHHRNIYESDLEEASYCAANKWG